MANSNRYAGRAGQPLISAGRIYPVKIFVPPKVLQERFVVLVDRIEKLSASGSCGKEKLESIFSVLLHRAFSGDLTAKWREAHMKELLAEMEQQAKLLGHG